MTKLREAIEQSVEKFFYIKVVVANAEFEPNDRPPYSPDLILSDYRLFPTKRALLRKGIFFRQ